MLMNSWKRMAKGIAEAVRREKSHDDMMYMQMQCDAVQPGRGLNNFGFYCGLWIWLSFCLFVFLPFSLLFIFLPICGMDCGLGRWDEMGRKDKKGITKPSNYYYCRGFVLSYPRHHSFFPFSSISSLINSPVFPRSPPFAAPSSSLV